MPLAASPDLRAVRTTDGSLTLRSDQWRTQYHSVHGAVQESVHVFIKTGLLHVLQEKVRDRPVVLLEVGLGTGLNLLLTWIRCLEGRCAVDYTALEPYPLQQQRLLELGYWEELGWPGLKEPFLKMMSGVQGVGEAGSFQFRMLQEPVEQLDMEGVFDLVYYDAFGPNTQPEMWTTEVFHRVHKAMRPGGVLVTYCAKGDVRRAMKEVGFILERPPGPIGKREMIRATRA